MEAHIAHSMTGPETILDELLCCFPPDFIRLTPEQQRVSLELYHLLAKGQPVAREQLAQAVSMTSGKVADILSRWGGVYCNATGGVIGYWGLALSKTPHCIEVNGRRLYTWCAWDSLFIPGLLGTTTHVESRCPVTGDRIALTVTPDLVTRVSPPDVAMSFLRPDPSRVREDVVTNFCHDVFFFSSNQAGRTWVGDHPGTFLLSLADAFSLARQKNAVEYPDVLG